MSTGDWDKLLKLLSSRFTVMRLDPWTSSAIYDLHTAGYFHGSGADEVARQTHFSASAQNAWFRANRHVDFAARSEQLIGLLHNQLRASSLTGEGKPTREACDWVAGAVLDRIQTSSRSWVTGAWRLFDPTAALGNCRKAAEDTDAWWTGRQEAHS